MGVQFVTFRLSDFGWQGFLDRVPRVFFRPTNPGVQGRRIMPDTPVQATLSSTGYGEVPLTTTSDVLPSGTGYRITVDWLLSVDGPPDVRPWAEFPHTVFILPGVTDIGQIIGREVRNDMVYVATDSPDPGEYTGFQLNPATGDLYQRVG